MSLIDHLRELRRRMAWIAVGLLVGLGFGWWQSDWAMRKLTAPLDEIAANAGLEVHKTFTEVSAPLDLKLRVALFLGIVVSSPWWLFQIGLFMTPGLTRKEKRVTLALAAIAFPMFLGGVAFAWWAIPSLLDLFLGAAPEGFGLYLETSQYLIFTTQVILTFGVMFVFPLFMVALTLPQVVRGKTWAKGWRWAVVVIATVAAIVTPSADVLSMLLVSAPMIVLYLLGVGVCLLVDRRADRKTAALGLTVDLEEV
ncbi:MAG: twin-arginine translocase subunit TatC [Micrococcales bacterium]|nr:twin-arginine translocase subunit TatC [Micrococcales bacterium]MCL2666798.1 twin-arginine translocase subunit TatC [Micrococcales bacterium]